MATNTLTDQNISDTYTGLLHAQGATFGAGQVLIYDGGGVASSLKLGIWGQGVTVGGPLSAASLTVNSLIYPSTDGTAGQFIKTDGSGTLSFATFAATDLPAVVPNPAATYVGLSSITVDSYGRVTQVKQASGGGSATSQYWYATPIEIYNSPNQFSGTVDTTQSNIPSDATYAILRIQGTTGIGSGGSTSTLTTQINGIDVIRFGNHDAFFNNADEVGNNIVMLWYAELDGTNGFDLDVTYNLYSKVNITIDLLGFANFQTLSNP